MIGRSFKQTIITLATLTAIAAIIALWSTRGPDQDNTISVVPIALAEARGAADWSQQAREAFLQDETNQWSAGGSNPMNRATLGPQQWLPPSDQCRYISRFVQIMERYDLDSSQNEMKRLRSQRQQCYTQFQ